MLDSTQGVRSWTLTDVQSGTWAEAFDLSSDTPGLDDKTIGRWSIRKWALRGGLGDGVDVLEVDNGAMAFVVLPTRGMGIWRGRYRGMELGWRAPLRGPVHPKFVNLADRAGLGWLAGFDEMIVRCGLDSNGAPCTDQVVDNNGNLRSTPLPLHGRIANTPASRVEVEFIPGDPPTLAVTGEVEEATLFTPNLLLRTRIATAVGSNAFTIEDEVVNRRGVAAELQMLYHCNFGPPTLEDGATLLAPSRRVAPRDGRAAEDAAVYAAYLGPTPGYVEQVYYHELAAGADGRTLAALVNRARDKAVAVRFDTAQLPCFAQWKNTIPLSDGYVTGLEPATNFPNSKPFERENGRVVQLAPDSAWRTSLTVQAFDSVQAVSALSAEIESLAAGQAAEILLSPRAGWSRGAK